MAERTLSGLPNKEYWIERASYIEEEAYKMTDKKAQEIAKVYEKAIAEAQTKINSFMMDYSTENHISIQEAQRALTGIELSDYRNRMAILLERYEATKSPFALRDISILTRRGQVTRLQGLINELEVELGLLAFQTEEMMTVHLEEIAKEAYYQMAYTIAEGVSQTGVGVTFYALNREAINEILSYNWSGEMFSTRIWNNKKKLIATLKTTLTDGIIAGNSTQQMARTLRDKMDNSYFNANRLIRTESNFVLSEATARGYKSTGLEQYEFLATLDDRTSKTCGSLDRKVFDLSNRQVGVNCNPMHPFCRSTTMPYFDDDYIGRISKADGEKQLIDGGMSYEEWRSQWD